MELKNVPLILREFYEENTTFVCLSSGPSLNQEQIDIVGKAKEKNLKIKVIACNDNWQWKYNEKYISDYLYAADEAWWQVHLEDIRKADFDKPLMIPLRKDYAEKNDLLLIPGVHQNGLGKKEKIRGFKQWL